MECDDEGLEKYLEEQQKKEMAEAGEKKESSTELKFDDGKYLLYSIRDYWLALMSYGG